MSLYRQDRDSFFLLVLYSIPSGVMTSVPRWLRNMRSHSTGNSKLCAAAITGSKRKTEAKVTSIILFIVLSPIIDCLRVQHFHAAGGLYPGCGAKQGPAGSRA